MPHFLVIQILLLESEIICAMLCPLPNQLLMEKCQVDYPSLYSTTMAIRYSQITVHPSFLITLAKQSPKPNKLSSCNM